MSIVEKNLGLIYGWQQGENNWHTGMDANLKMLGAIVGLSVRDRDLNAPPENAAHGERYIVAANATGAWKDKSTHIAVRSEDGWDFYPPRVGWLCYIVDEGKLAVYTSAGWSAGLAM